MEGFKVGDRVMLIPKYAEMLTLTGIVGTIVSSRISNRPTIQGKVFFDVKWDNGSRLTADFATELLVKYELTV